MSEEAKSFAAVATFAENEEAAAVEVPGDIAEVRAKLQEIADKYGMGEVLSDEDQLIIKAYLPAIGCNEVGVSPDNALVGGGSYAFERSELGCDFKVEGNMWCKGVGEGRIEYYNEMKVAKTGGDAKVLDMAFTFRGVSYGMGPSGALKVLYKREFTRSFSGVDAAAASFDDRYTFTQWGFFYTASCDVATSKGTVTLS